MIIRNTLALGIILFFYHSLFAQTCTSINNGYWQYSSTWSCSGGVGPYPDGVWRGGTHIVIDFDVTIENRNPKTIDLSSSNINTLLIKANRKLIFENNTKLILPQDAKVVLEDGAQIVGPGNNSNTLIEIGNNEIWGKCDGCSTGTLTGPGTMDENSTPSQPLPIELLYFKGETSKVGVTLDWATASENNFDYFSVERSSDAQNFSSITTIKGQGNSNAPVNYEYVDNQALSGLNYYRLKAIDFDGYTEYFNVIAVYVPATEKMVQVYPNPVLGKKVNIHIYSKDQKQLEMAVQDLSGKTLFKRQLQIGWNEVPLHSEIETGTYTLTVKGDGINHTQLLILE